MKVWIFLVSLIAFTSVHAQNDDCNIISVNEYGSVGLMNFYPGMEIELCTDNVKLNGTYYSANYSIYEKGMGFNFSTPSTGDVVLIVNFKEGRGQFKLKYENDRLNFTFVVIDVKKRLLLEENNRLNEEKRQKIYKDKHREFIDVLRLKQEVYYNKNFSGQQLTHDDLIEIRKLKDAIDTLSFTPEWYKSDVVDWFLTRPYTEGTDVSVARLFIDTDSLELYGNPSLGIKFLETIDIRRSSLEAIHDICRMDKVYQRVSKQLSEAISKDISVVLDVLLATNDTASFLRWYRDLDGKDYKNPIHSYVYGYLQGVDGVVIPWVRDVTAIAPNGIGMYDNESLFYERFKNEREQYINTFLFYRHFNFDAQRYWSATSRSPEFKKLILDVRNVKLNFDYNVDIGIDGELKVKLENLKYVYSDGESEILMNNPELDSVYYVSLDFNHGEAFKKYLLEYRGYHIPQKFSGSVLMDIYGGDRVGKISLDAKGNWSIKGDKFFQENKMYYFAHRYFFSGWIDGSAAQYSNIYTVVTSYLLSKSGHKGFWNVSSVRLGGGFGRDYYRFTNSNGQQYVFRVRHNDVFLEQKGVIEVLDSENGKYILLEKVDGNVGAYFF